MTSEADKKTIEESFTYKGYPCVVKFMPWGVRCGYVGIPEENFLYDFNKDDLNMLICCHGGVTYDNRSLPGDDRKGIRWIGFDCGHVGDAKDFQLAKERYGNDPDFTMDMHDIDILSKNHPNGEYGIVRSKDYVKTECEVIVEQFISMNRLAYFVLDEKSIKYAVYSYQQSGEYDEEADLCDFFSSKEKAIEYLKNNGYFQFHDRYDDPFRWKKETKYTPYFACVIPIKNNANICILKSLLVNNIDEKYGITLMEES